MEWSGVKEQLTETIEYSSPDWLSQRIIYIFWNLEFSAKDVMYNADEPPTTRRGIHGLGEFS